MINAKLLQTRSVSYEDLCLRGLINDLNESAICEVKTVCHLACNRCPYPLDNIDTKKIKLKGLKTDNITLQKMQNEQLLIIITAPGIDDWLLKNNLLFPPLKTIKQFTKLLKKG